MRPAQESSTRTPNAGSATVAWPPRTVTVKGPPSSAACRPSASVSVAPSGGSAGQAVAAAGPPPHPPCLSAVCAEMLAWLLERDHELEQLAGFARLTTKWAAKWPAFKGPGQELLGGITQWVRAKYGFTLTLSTRLLP